MSSSIANFNSDKYNIIYKLEEYSTKMKLTDSYINTFNYISEFSAFNYYCKKYNQLIDECKSLKNKLEKMKKWGYIFNSRNYWFNKLTSIKSHFISYSINISKIYALSFKCKYSYIADESYITYQINEYNKLKLYLNTHMMNGKIIYIQDGVQIILNSDYLV